MIGNSMTLYSAAVLYNKSKSSQQLFVSALFCGIFGIFYGVGVLRLFQWGYRLNDWKLYPITIGVLGMLMPWSIYRYQQV